MIPLPEGLRAEMSRYGLMPPQFAEPERFRRFPGADKDKHNTAGWLKVRADGSAVFGDLSRDISESWQPFRDRPMTHDEIEALRAEAVRHKAEAEAKKKSGRTKNAPPSEHGSCGRRRKLPIRCIRTSSQRLSIRIGSARSANDY
jgi:hypothetical protein